MLFCFLFLYDTTCRTSHLVLWLEHLCMERCAFFNQELLKKNLEIYQKNR